MTQELNDSKVKKEIITFPCGYMIYKIPEPN